MYCVCWQIFIVWRLNRAPSINWRIVDACKWKAARCFFALWLVNCVASAISHTSYIILVDRALITTYSDLSVVSTVLHGVQVFILPLSFADSAPLAVVFCYARAKNTQCERERGRERDTKCQPISLIWPALPVKRKSLSFPLAAVVECACIRTDLIHYKIIAFLSASYQLSLFHWTELFHVTCLFLTARSVFFLFHPRDFRCNSFYGYLKRKNIHKDYAHSVYSVMCCLTW